MHIFKSHSLFQLSLVLLCLIAQEVEARIVLEQGLESISLGTDFDFVEDASGSMHFEDVRFSNTQREFSPGYDVGFGGTRSAYWIRIDLISHIPHVSHWVLDLKEATASYVDAYYRDLDGTLRKIETGNMRPFRNRPIVTGSFALPFSVAAMGNQQIVLRLRTLGPMKLPLTLWSESAYREQLGILHVFQGALAGMMLMMALYNFFILISTRDISYLYYSLYVIATLLFTMDQLGLTAMLIWPDAPWMATYTRPLGPCLIGIFGLLFMRSFLRLRMFVPRLDNAVRLTIFYCAVLAMASTKIEPFVTMNLVVLGAAVFIVLIFGGGLYALYLGIREARYFCLAWFFLLFSMVQFILMRLDLVPTNIWTYHSLIVGSTIESMLLSFALADRIKLMRETGEKLRTVRAEEAVRYEAEINAKDEFLATMSHEIRTPLAGVVSTMELINVEKVPAEERHYLQLSKRAAWEIIGVLNQILDLSKIGSPRVDIEEENFDLEELLSDLVRLHSSKARRKGVDMVLCFDPGVPSSALGDKVKLHKVLGNLISNATKFTDSGHILISVTSGEIGEKGNFLLQVVVEDSGSGMSEFERKVVFNPYYQTRSSENSQKVGTGLGMAIAKGLVETMAGVITVYENDYQGSSFDIQVPFKTNSADARQVYQHSLQTDITRTMLFISQHTMYGKQLRMLALQSGWQDVSCPDIDAMSSDEMSALCSESDANFLLIETASAALLPNFGAILKQRGASAKKTFVLNDPMQLAPFIRADLSQPVSELERDPNLVALLNSALDVDIDSPRESAEPVEEKRFPHISVLMVEDHAMNRVAMSIQLSRLAITCLEAKNGEEAIRIFEDEHQSIDLILMDGQMPIMNGFDTTGYIRTFESANKLASKPIVFLSADVTEACQSRAFEAGADFFEGKPLRPNRLQWLLQQVEVENTTIDGRSGESLDD